jgi:hypothetical protein
MGPGRAEVPVLRAKVAGRGRPAVLASYRRAVAAMIALPFTDPRNWYRQALIHVMDCPHGNFWFLPWHRGYLARFEAICAEMSGDPGFRLPYWDYTESPTAPDAFFDDGLDCGKPPFVQAADAVLPPLQVALEAAWPSLSADQRTELSRRGLTTPQAVIARARGYWNAASGKRKPTRDTPALVGGSVIEVTPNKLSAALNLQTFTTFGSSEADNHSQNAGGGDFERGVHGQIHVNTGGFMGNFMSPVDPLFWLHHANLDRLWDIWLQRWGSEGRDPFRLGAGRPKFDAEKFVFFCDAHGRSAPTRAGDCLSATDLGYAYERGSMSEMASPLLAAPERNRLLATSPLRDKMLREGWETGETLALPRALFAPSLALDEPGEVVAEITLALPRSAEEVNIRVFLNHPGLSRSTPITDPHYAGSISFFGGLHDHTEGEDAGAPAHHDGDHQPTPDTLVTRTVVITLGPTLRALGEEGRLPRDAIRVQLMPESDADVDLVGGALEQVTIAVR